MLSDERAGRQERARAMSPAAIAADPVSYHAIRAADRRGPVCGRPVTVGVMHRVEDGTKVATVFTPEVAQGTTRLLTWSPDGNWIAYTVNSTDLAKDKSDTDIWMVKWDGGASVTPTDITADVMPPDAMASFGQDNFGEHYVTSLYGQVYRIDPK